MNYIKKLQNIGFKKSEAEIYTICLKFDSVKVSQISNEIDIPRSSIYIHLKALISKGYIKKTKRNNIEHFSAIEPQAVLDDFENKVDDFVKILPYLEKLKDIKGKGVHINFYDTAKGVRMFYDKLFLLKENDSVHYFESALATQQVCDTVGWEFVYRWQKRLAKKKIKMHGINAKNMVLVFERAPSRIQQAILDRGTELLVVDSDKFKFDVNMYLINLNTVIIISPQGPFVLVIEDKYLFNFMFEVFKKVSKDTEIIKLKTLFN